MSGKRKANFVLGFSWGHENDRYKRSEAGKKSGESRRNKSEQTRTKRTSVPFVEQTQTNANKSEQTRTKRTVTVTDTVTGTVTVSVNNKPPDGTAPDGAAPPASSMQPARK